VASWKSEFSGTEKNNFFMAQWKCEFSLTELICFSWRLEKAIFHKLK
jgi:hypothetical protein